MEKIQAKRFDDKVIELSSSNDLEKVYEMINKDENFIIQWGSKDFIHSMLIIGTNVSSRIKNGDILLISKEAKK